MNFQKNFTTELREQLVSFTKVAIHCQPLNKLVIMLGTTTLPLHFTNLPTECTVITTNVCLVTACVRHVASHCWWVHNLWLDVSHVSPSYRPSPVVAHDGWTYQLRSRIRVSPSFSWISWGFIATNRILNMRNIIATNRILNTTDKFNALPTGHL